MEMIFFKKRSTFINIVTQEYIKKGMKFNCFVTAFIGMLKLNQKLP